MPKFLLSLANSRFLRGAGSVLDVSACSYRHAIDHRSPEVRDADALAADWVRIGNDIRSAMNRQRSPVDGQRPAPL